MDLQRTFYPVCTLVQVAALCAAMLFFPAVPSIAQSKSRLPELIRDTEEDRAAEAATVTERNPALSEQSIRIGDFYYKKKNYAAAISRYLEAIEYQPDSARAYDALARAYEKKGEPAKAISAYKEFVAKNPDSPKTQEFREKLQKLEKAAP